MNDIFKPRDKNDIMADIMETDIENIPYVLKLYNMWKGILFSGKEISDKNLKSIHIDLLNTYMPNEKSSGLLGLKRSFIRWENEYISSDLLIEILKDWMNWVYHSLEYYRTHAGLKYVCESIKDILKPKSKEDILREYIKLPISKQVDFLDEVNYNNYDFSNKFLIPFEYWPLILKIKHKLKQNNSFNNLFRVTSNDIMCTNDAIIGVMFKIYYREEYIHPIPPIRIYQYDKYPRNIYLTYGGAKGDFSEEREIIKNYEELIDWINKKYFYKKDPINWHYEKYPWEPGSLKIKY
jgi:hypothetical protein